MQATRLRLLIPGLFFGGLLLAPGIGRAQSPATDAAPRQPQGCDLYLAMARTAAPSRERSFALRALKDCPKDAAISRTLESAIQSDDYAARSAALDSLENHLDRATIPFLTRLYDTASPADLDTESEIRVFEYLSRLAEPKPAAGATGQNQARVPARILRRGLYHTSSRVRQAALLGLGRLDEAAHWPLIQAVLLDPPGPGERIAALQAARAMQTRNSLEALAAARAALGFPAAGGSAGDAGRMPERPGSESHANPGLELAAIELLGALPGPRALETLLIYRVRRSNGANAAALRKTLAARLDPKKGYAWSIAPARLHRQATERSPIAAAVASHTILYIEETTGLGYRLPPVGQRRQPESNWLRVRTTAGLTGWVHASRIQRIPVPGAN